LVAGPGHPVHTRSRPRLRQHIDHRFVDDRVPSCQLRHGTNKRDRISDLRRREGLSAVCRSMASNGGRPGRGSPASGVTARRRPPKRDRSLRPGCEGIASYGGSARHVGVFVPHGPGRVRPGQWARQEIGYDDAFRTAARPHRLVAKDTTLSRWRHGFESRWGCQEITPRSESRNGHASSQILLHRTGFVLVDGRLIEQGTVRRRRN
jgi:hypothetical protein